MEDVAVEAKVPSSELVVGKEIPGLASVGVTVVVGPEIIDKINQAVGDGRGEFDVRRLLRGIARNEADLDKLNELAEKMSKEKPNELFVRSIGDDLAAAAYAIEFVSTSIINEAHHRNVESPDLWTKIFILRDRPYAIASLKRTQKSFLDLLSLGRQPDDKKLPSYNWGKLDGLYPNGGLYTEETTNHLVLGSFERRLAAIIDQRFKTAVDNIQIDPDSIDVGIKDWDGFPDGRLYTTIKNKKLQ